MALGIDGDNPASSAPARAATRLAALDAMRDLAVLRVIAWHTWGWWPLSWFAAMPAMFFVAGVLLGNSFARGGPSIIRVRLRRLLVPFWVYSAVAVATMVAMGWQPGWTDIAPWVLPLADPIGSDEAPGLWIPLWYLRAYLWFLLVSPMLWWAVRRWGWRVPACFAAGIVVQQRFVGEIPLGVTDFVTYGLFVTAGLVLSQRDRSVVDLPRRPLIALLGVGSVAGVVIATQVGPTVNSDYLLVATVGIATISLLLIASRPLDAFARGAGRSVVSWISSRALSLYLWQGFGLLAADRLVTQRDLPIITDVVASAVVVFSVTFLLAAFTAGIEDFAARRAVRRPSLRASLGGLGAIAVVGVALAVPVQGGVPTLPPSGAAALAAAAEIEASLDDGTTDDAPAARRPDGSEVAGRLLRDVEEHMEVVGEGFAQRGLNTFALVAHRKDGVVATATWTHDGGVVPGGAERRVIWYSNAKAATAIWMLDLVRRGVVALDDPVGRHLPEVPHGDRITLQDLARHQSGIPSSADSPIAEDAYADWEGLIDQVDVGADVREWMASGELVAEPGTAWNYSRVGYSILAWALERASGTSWQDAMRDLGRRAGVDLLLDEEVAPAGTSNRHPGEGSYRGALYAAGGIESSAEDVVTFFHWALTEFLGPDDVALMNTASPDKFLAYAGVGVTLQCPCEETDGVVRGRRVGNGGNNGGWRHDLRTGTTMGVFPNRMSDDDGLITGAPRLLGEFFDAVDG